MVAAWVDEEFATLRLGDQRLDKRAAMILYRLSQFAESPPEVCRDKAALEATYRFASNPRAQPEAILKAHNEASVARSTKHPSVVLVQDTTVVDLTKPSRQVEGAGPLESNDKSGCFVHPLYAITESGLPLGLVDQVIWTRSRVRSELSRAEKERLRKEMAFEEKESCRWLEMHQSGEQIARANPPTHYISVADSEADVYEIYEDSQELPANYDFVIRACQNRSLIREDGNGPANVDEAFAETEVSFESQAEVSERKPKIAGETRCRRKARSARLANISVRAREVTMRGPSRDGGSLAAVTLNVVEAVETDPPSGEEPIRWVLFTTLPISTTEEIQRVIELYGVRWQIELYFKTLKSGLGIEKLKYERFDRYLTALSLSMIAGWRVEQFKGADRVDPEGSCETYFDPDEWKSVHMVREQGKPLPPEPPTVHQFVLMVAELGGYLNKKGQGPPGSKTLWRGLRRMEAYTEAYRAFQNAN